MDARGTYAKKPGDDRDAIIARVPELLLDTVAYLNKYMQLRCAKNNVVL